jgi:son of sevenless
MWVNQEILERDDAKKRAVVIKYFISVAEVPKASPEYLFNLISVKRCHTLRNYSTMAALIAALNRPPIRRLKRTKLQVGGRAMASLENCEKIFDPSRNFYVYRHELLSVQSPCVPFLGKFKSLKQTVGVITRGL